MTTDMILMLTTLDSIVWTTNHRIYAFPTEDTDPEVTNGWGVDVEMPYTLKIEANIKAKINDIGKCCVSAMVTFTNPYGEKSENTILREVTVNLSFMREKNWDEFVSILQSLILDGIFWRIRKDECEDYLRRNAPAIPDFDLPM